MDGPGEGIVVGVRVTVVDRPNEAAARGDADHLVRRRTREGEDPKEFLGGGRSMTEQVLAEELAHAEGLAGLPPRSDHRSRDMIGRPTELSPHVQRCGTPAYPNTLDAASSRRARRG